MHNGAFQNLAIFRLESKSKSNEASLQGWCIVVRVIVRFLGLALRSPTTTFTSKCPIFNIITSCRWTDIGSGMSKAKTKTSKKGSRKQRISTSLYTVTSWWYHTEQLLIFSFFFQVSCTISLIIFVILDQCKEHFRYKISAWSCFFYQILNVFLRTLNTDTAGTPSVCLYTRVWL